MGLRCVKLPARPLKSKKSIDVHADEAGLIFLGGVAIKSEEKIDQFLTDKNGKESVRKISNSYLLMVWKDTVSGKLFWWYGRRVWVYMLRMKDVDHTYSSWPAQLFEVKKRQIKDFLYFIKSWGMEFKLSDDEEERVRLQKNKLIKNILHIVGAKRRQR